MPRRGSLASVLHSSARQYEKRLDTHLAVGWGGGTIVPELLQVTREFASTLLESGFTMVRLPSEKLSSRLAVSVLEKPRVSVRLSGRLELEVAKSFSLATDEMAQRCIELARIVLTNPPGEAVQRFLQRLGRCYVAGFFPEAVIMCRAVLENAVNEKFQRERKPFPPVAEGRSSMRAKLQRAEDLGWLSRPQRNAAWTIWERGSTAAHRDPGATKAVLSTIESTVALLRVLYA